MEKNFGRKGEVGGGGLSGGIYGLALLGAAYYYLQNANSPQDWIFGILKAIVWPAILIYKLLVFLN